MSSRLFKICDFTRKVKKVVAADSYEDLLQKAAVKLSLNGNLRIFLDGDGTEVEDWEVLELLQKDDRIIVLESHQSWEDATEIQSNSSQIQMDEVGESDGTNEAKSEKCTDSIRAPDKERKITSNDSTCVISSANYHSQVPTLRASDDSLCNSSASILVYQDLELPTLSAYVQRQISKKESHSVWGKLISECAHYYMATFPEIGKNNSSGDYREIGRQMYSTYPAIAREGTHPWSFFVKSLSQKIRRIRWDTKRKSLKTDMVTETIPSPKRFKIVHSEPSEECDEETYESHVNEMAQEMEKKEPNKPHIRALMKATFTRRRKWVQELPAGSALPIFERFPTFKEPTFIMTELRYLLQVPSLKDVMDKLNGVFQAVSGLKKMVYDESSPAVLKTLETETSFRRVKGKSKSIVEVVQLESGKIERLLSSSPLSAPKLVAIQKDEKFVNMAIVCDAMYILLDTAKIAEATAVLIGMYYLTDFEYPKMYSQVLGFLQQTVLQQKYEGQKTSGFIQFLNKLTREMEG